MYQKIISAIDGSFHSELAARHAIAIAASCGSELMVFTVDTGEVEREELSSSVDRICQHAKKYGVQARGVVRGGELLKPYFPLFMLNMLTCWLQPLAAVIIDCLFKALHNSSCLKHPARSSR